MFPEMKFQKRYPDLTIKAEVSVLPIDDCDLVLVVEYDDNRMTLTSPVTIDATTFPQICAAINHEYMDDDRCEFWIMEALNQLPLPEASRGA